MKEKSDVLNNQAIILASDGAYNEAIACFKRAITLERDNYLLWYNLGITYRDAGDLEEAKQALYTAYTISPENLDVEETYATVCLMMKDFDSVRAICETGIDFNPLHSHLWNLMGVCEFQSENYEKAAEYFEYAVSINPYYLDALYNLKDTYSVIKNQKGEAECEKAIKELEK